MSWSTKKLGEMNREKKATILIILAVICQFFSACLQSHLQNTQQAVIQNLVVIGNNSAVSADNASKANLWISNALICQLNNGFDEDPFCKATPSTYRLLAERGMKLESSSTEALDQYLGVLKKYQSISRNNRYPIFILNLLFLTLNVSAVILLLKKDKTNKLSLKGQQKAITNQTKG